MPVCEFCKKINSPIIYEGFNFCEDCFLTYYLGKQTKHFKFLHCYKCKGECLEII